MSIYQGQAPDIYRSYYEFSVRRTLISVLQRSLTYLQVKCYIVIRSAVTFEYYPETSIWRARHLKKAAAYFAKESGWSTRLSNNIRLRMQCVYSAPCHRCITAVITHGGTVLIVSVTWKINAYWPEWKHLGLRAHACMVTARCIMICMHWVNRVVSIMQHA